MFTVAYCWFILPTSRCWVKIIKNEKRNSPVRGNLLSDLQQRNKQSQVMLTCVQSLVFYTEVNTNLLQSSWQGTPLPPLMLMGLHTELLDRWDRSSVWWTTLYDFLKAKLKHSCKVKLHKHSYFWLGVNHRSFVLFRIWESNVNYHSRLEFPFQQIEHYSVAQDFTQLLSSFI